MNWKNYLSVLFFGFFGGITRAILNNHFNFYGTFLANLLGCFLLALITYFSINYKNLADWLTVGLGTGFVGAFTTFSSFNLDSWKFLLKGQDVNFALYFIFSLALGFLVASLGAKIGEKLGLFLTKED